MSSIRVGLLVGETMSTWKVRAVRRMLENTDTEITLIIKEKSRQDGNGPTKFDRIRSAISDGLWGISRLPAGTFMETSPHEQPQYVDSIDCFAGVEQRSCYPQEADGLGNTLTDKIVDLVSAETDVLLRDAFGILKGDVLAAPKYGVWSFHGGDIRKYRGKPAGFWEFMHDEQEMGVTLQRIDETLDGGEIVAFETVNIGDAYTWQEVKSRIYEAEISLLEQGIQNIQKPEFDPSKPDTLGEVYTTPTTSGTIRYLLKNNTGRVERIVKQNLP